MKRLLASLGFLILATGCDQNSPIVPSPVPFDEPPPQVAASLTGVVTLMTVDGAVPVEGALVELLQNGESVMSVKPGKTRTASRKADYQVVLSTFTDADGRYSFEGV